MDLPPCSGQFSRLRPQAQVHSAMQSQPVELGQSRIRGRVYRRPRRGLRRLAAPSIRPARGFQSPTNMRALEENRSPTPPVASALRSVWEPDLVRRPCGSRRRYRRASQIKDVRRARLLGRLAMNQTTSNSLIYQRNEGDPIEGRFRRAHKLHTRIQHRPTGSGRDTYREPQPARGTRP